MSQILNKNLIYHRRGGPGSGWSPYFNLFSKARVQERQEFNLFSIVFKPAKPGAQIMMPEPDPSPQKSGPTLL
jgi:hypothetical protein